jgi:hypothetical protein
VQHLLVIDTKSSLKGNNRGQPRLAAGISGKTVASGVGVIVNSSGQLGTVLSSERFKEAIKPMDKVSGCSKLHDGRNTFGLLRNVYTKRAVIRGRRPDRLFIADG